MAAVQKSGHNTQVTRRHQLMSGTSNETIVDVLLSVLVVSFQHSGSKGSGNVPPPPNRVKFAENCAITLWCLNDKMPNGNQLGMQTTSPDFEKFLKHTCLIV